MESKQNDDQERTPDLDDAATEGTPTAPSDSRLIEPQDAQTPVACATAQPDRQSKRKQITFRITVGFIVVALVSLLISGYITYREPDFSPLAVAIGSLGALILFFTARNRMLRPSLITLGVVALAIGSAYLWFEIINGNGGKSNIAVRITNPDGESVARASVFLMYGGEIPIKQITDSNGNATFTADDSFGEARLVAEASGYQVYEEALSLSRSRTIPLSLRPLDEDERSVVVRVVNKEKLQPVNNAKVILITAGNTFNDLTDQNGLATFKITFTSDTLDVDLTVEGGDNSISNQSVSLRPDQLQEVRLDTINKTANIAPVLAIERSDTPAAGSIGYNAPDVLPVSLFDASPPVGENEPNDTLGSAQALDSLGANYPITGEIDAFTDNDYYAIDAVAGRSYVVELFDVDGKLGLSTSDYNCFGSYGTYKGLGLAVYDPGENPVATQCKQNRGGNTFSGLSFQAKVDGVYVVRVFPNSEKVVGTYKLRVAPKYGEDAASWQRISFEPNNEAPNEFPIKPGYESALTSAIDPQQSSYIAELADEDWYQFNAVAGRTYVVELFNVEDLLGLGSSDYYCDDKYGNYSGLGLALLAPNLDTITTTCTPSGSASVHSVAELTATVNGVHYIRVFSHVARDTGIYSLRVVPKHDQPAGTSDPASLEPNNRLPNASALTLDAEVKSAFEERPAGYSTNVPDRDWYYFQAEAGATYVIELSNVADTLILGSDEYYCFGAYGRYTGLAIAAYNAAAEFLSSQCTPAGEGAVHSKIEIEALVNNNYYIQVLPHFPQGYGEYSIGVRKK
ncbi:MAG: hypothetical protein H7Z42_11495 [Roseiflexaceae bacterium]|nr:hypothetical protein [Roseiflexaceae bacterium]